VGGLTLSQTSLSLNVGQSVSVTATYPVYNYSNSFYISSNSNSAVASASVSGNQINVYGLAYGSANISVCANGSSCATLYVTVSGNGNNYGTITFSPSSVNLAVGQSSTVFVNAGYLGSSLYISSNSNSGVVSASISGSTLYLQAGNIGNSTITVCQNYSVCGYLYVTVGGSGSGSLSLSQTSVSLNVGQTSVVTAYNYNSGSLYVSSNSNSNVVSASVSGSSISLYGLAAGSATVNICSNNVSSCASVYVTVTGSIYSGSIYFSPTSLSLNAGQNSTVSIYNNNSYGGYYISSNSNSGVASASVSGSSLYVNALSSGSTSIVVCQSSYGSSCATLYVTVTGSSYNYGNLYFSPSSLTLAAGQSSTATVYGNSGGSYYLSNYPNSSVATAYMSGNQLTVTGVAAGNTSITVCQSYYSSSCASLSVTVTGVLGANTNLWFSPGNPSLYVGQSLAVSINSSAYSTVYPYYSTAYYISSNSNPNAVSASISGTVLNLYANQNGSSNITVCHSSLGFCGTLYVTVGGGGYYYYGSGLQYPGSQSSVLGASTYANGQLIAEGQTVYIVYKNTKTAFSSSAAFLGLGFKFGNALQVGNSGLTDSGYTVTTSRAQHPWGSWIKSGTTVYFVHESGLIPVPDWNTFLNNGGQSSFIVPANSYDFRLPMLSPMVSGDSRLQ
jgi:uncharacterized cupredoxin-like copper-binding protein